MTSPYQGKSERAEFDAQRRMFKEGLRNPKGRVDRPETGHPLEVDSALPRTGPQHYAGDRVPRPPKPEVVKPLTPAWRDRAPRVGPVKYVGKVTHVGGGRSK
jgi:hypothetical protein